MYITYTSRGVAAVDQQQRMSGGVGAAAGTSMCPVVADGSMQVCLPRGVPMYASMMYSPLMTRYGVDRQRCRWSIDGPVGSTLLAAA
jgi:hypothetical protein